MNNKIEELRKEQQALNDKIDALEQELKQTEPQGKWKPKQGEWYYVANPVNFRFYEEYEWGNDETDKHCYNAGLIRKTPEEATELSKQMYYRQWFDSLSDVTAEMWEDIGPSKYYSYYDYNSSRVCVGDIYFLRSAKAYFTSHEKLYEAIETIGGEDVFKRYVLGVEQ